MPTCILHVSQHQFRYVSHWKCVTNYEAQNIPTDTLQCWTTKAVCQARMGNNSTCKASKMSVLCSQMIIECWGKGDVTQWYTGRCHRFFWNVLKAWNSKWENICKNKVVVIKHPNFIGIWGCTFVRHLMFSFVGIKASVFVVSNESSRCQLVKKLHANTLQHYDQPHHSSWK